MTCLRTLAKTCEFQDTNEELVDQIIEKRHSSKLRKRLLREPDLSYDEVMNIVQAMEAADRHARQYQDNSDKKDINTTHIRDTEDKELLHSLTINNRTQSKSAIHVKPKQQMCYRCGSLSHYANKCEVTRGKSCNKCGRMGHFSKVCQSKEASKPHQTVRYITPQDDDSDSDFTFAINHQHLLPLTTKSQLITPTLTL